MRRALLCLPLLAAAAPLMAQTAPARPAAPPASAAPVQAHPELRKRIDALPALFAGTQSYDAYFAPAFRAQVPKAAFDTLLAQLQAAYGPITGIGTPRTITRWEATLPLDFQGGTAPLHIAVDPAAPHHVTGLMIGAPTAREATLAQVQAALAALPGSTGFVLSKLGDAAPQPLVQHNADRSFAIGSEFKLVILAELARATRAGERRWDDMVTLDGTSLPAGGYRGKPAGTRVSLRDLARDMISLSDNSATDLLLAALGREKVEAMLPVIGIRDPARNRPFLSTGEIFKLKGIGGGALARRYLALDEAGRRAMLAGEVAATPLESIDAALFAAGKPLDIERLEWFATPADLVRVMDWLRRHGDGPDGAELRAILAKSPGIPAPVAAKWRYVGYKGGSEPGVIAMTLLLQSQRGDWYALSASWNDPARPLTEARFAALVARAAELAVPAP